MAVLPTPEAGSRLPGILGGSSTTMRELYTDFVAHEVPLMILSDAFLCSTAIIEFLNDDEWKICSE